MVLQPVSFVFPENTYTNYISIYFNNTAMIGDSLLVVTVRRRNDQNICLYKFLKLFLNLSFFL